MKSKKAREFIDGHIAIDQRSFTAADIEYCAALAEADRDAKAVEAFKQMCPFHDGRCRPNCNDCARLNQFIQKLNE